MIGKLNGHTRSVTQVARSGPAVGELWDRAGLRTYEAARRVRDVGPLAFGVDGRFWAYHDGVWRPAPREVDTRICRVLGQRYRSSHGRDVRDVLKAELPEITVEPNPAINFPNGMLRWNARLAPSLVEHHPEEWSTVQLAVPWDPEAVCPAFDRFVAQVVPEDDRARLWQVIGYMMMSGNPLQRAFLLTGGGGNGKGLFLRVLRTLLGKENVSSLPLSDIAGDRWAGAELHGRLANICGDIDPTWIESTARIKEITGEDDIKGERKYGDLFYFEPWCKMIFSANGIPGASDSSTGWSRRWEVIGFPHPPAKPDRTLRHELTRPECLAGIAFKAVAALRELMAAGDFDHGESAVAAHQRFARKSNKVLMWMHETGHMDPTGWYPKSELWRAFHRWDLEEGGHTIGRNGFYERLAQVPGMAERRRVGRDGFIGFRLNADTAFGGVLDFTDTSDDTDTANGGKTAPELPQGLF